MGDRFRISIPKDGDSRSGSALALLKPGLNVSLAFGYRVSYVFI